MTSVSKRCGGNAFYDCDERGWKARLGTWSDISKRYPTVCISSTAEASILITLVVTICPTLKYHSYVRSCTNRIRESMLAKPTRDAVADVANGQCNHHSHVAHSAPVEGWYDGAADPPQVRGLCIVKKGQPVEPTHQLPISHATSPTTSPPDVTQSPHRLARGPCALQKARNNLTIKSTVAIVLGHAARLACQYQVGCRYADFGPVYRPNGAAHPRGLAVQ